MASRSNPTLSALSDGQWEANARADQSARYRDETPLGHSLPFAAIHAILRAMDSMNISLPHRLKAWIEGQVAEGRFSSASEYVRDLVRADEKAKAQAKLEGLLLEGLEGEATEWTEADSESLLRLAPTEVDGAHRRSQPRSTARSQPACAWLHSQADPDLATRFAQAAISSFAKLAQAAMIGSPLRSSARIWLERASGGLKAFPKS